MRQTRQACLTLGVALVTLLPVYVSRVDAQQVSPQEMYDKASQSLRAGDTVKAIKLYQQLLELDPERVEARTNLGVALAREGRYSEAIEQYRKALANEPTSEIVLINLALSLYKQADFGAAREPLITLHNLYPENRQAFYLLIDCYLRLGQFKDAITLAEPAYKAHPEDPAVQYSLGTALIQDGQTKRGAEVIDRILRNGTSARAKLLMGASQYAAGDFNNAAATLREALDLDPTLPDGWTFYGRVLLKEGSNQAAKAAFERALQLDPNDFDACLYLGGLLRHDGENEAASAYLKHALTLRPDSGAALFQVGALHAALGQLEQAKTELEAVTERWPDFLEAHAQLAKLYARMQRFEDSKREQSVVIRLNAEARSDGPQPDMGP